MTVITRFAPSPTGMLHIGGARTALFNVLLARHYGGKCLLRIEDTDHKRSTPEAIEAILEGLSWLALDADDTPVYQSQNAERHRDVALDLVARGKAFRCYTSPEALAARREAGAMKRAEAKNDRLSQDERARLRQEADALLAPYRSPWRDGGTPEDRTAPYTIRLRAPDTGVITIRDAVQGEVSVAAREIDDLILLRADGTPTYMLAVVVDDHDMGVTHIVRGDDHFRNSFRQVPILEAMGWPRPSYAHVPLIHGPDGAKLSKRHGAQSTLDYRDMGYLPEAMTAYLLRLGWSHGDQDIFTRAEAEALFTTEGLNKAPSRLDFDKLADVNAHFIRQCDPDRLLKLLRPFLQKHTPTDAALMDKVRQALPVLRERGSTLVLLAEAARFLWDANADHLTKKARKALRADGLARLTDLRHILEQTDAWTRKGLEEVLAAYCTERNLSIGQVGPPLRAALTGGLPAPDLAPVMAILGRRDVLERIDRQLTAHTGATHSE